MKTYNKQLQVGFLSPRLNHNLIQVLEPFFSSYSDIFRTMVCMYSHTFLVLLPVGCSEIRPLVQTHHSIKRPEVDSLVLLQAKDVAFGVERVMFWRRLVAGFGRTVTWLRCWPYILENLTWKFGLTVIITFIDILNIFGTICVLYGLVVFIFGTSVFLTRVSTIPDCVSWIFSFGYCIVFMAYRALRVTSMAYIVRGSFKMDNVFWNDTVFQLSPSCLGHLFVLQLPHLHINHI